MKRVILVLQYPTKMRYQEWWWGEFPKQLSKSFHVIVLGQSFVDFSKQSQVNKNDFAPTQLATQLETQQMWEYLDLSLLDNDILLLTDLSYPGIFANVLFHKRPSKCFAICHATSKNRYDYFAPVRHAKYPVEKGIAKLFDAVIVGSNYHKDKLGWGNVVTLPLPYPTCQTKYHSDKYGITAVSKRSLQKRTKSLEVLATKILKVPIFRFESNTWEEYYRQLNSYKVLLITSKEETFGYQVVDGVLAGCIVIAPNKFSYPELLPKEYLFSNKRQMLILLNKALHNELPSLKKLKTDKQSKSFFKELKKLLIR